MQLQVVELLINILAGESSLQLSLLGVYRFQRGLVGSLLLLEGSQIGLQRCDRGLLLALGSLPGTDLLLQLGVGAGGGIQLLLGRTQLPFGGGQIGLRLVQLVADVAALLGGVA